MGFEESFDKDPFVTVIWAFISLVSIIGGIYYLYETISSAPYPGRGGHVFVSGLVLFVGLGMGYNLFFYEGPSLISYK